MSTTVDERIVKMSLTDAGVEAGVDSVIKSLDRLDDKLKMDGASQGLENVQAAANSFNTDSAIESVSTLSEHFGRLQDYVFNVFTSLQGRVASFGKDMLNKLTVKPMVDGFGEYETQMKSIQTIMSNTGDQLRESGYETEAEQVAVINQKLDELNEYADKTIYNFSEMTRNIGTFTAAGVDLETATKSIQGISNLAAASGSSSQQASTAMYQLSQAISTGALKLQDWNSVVNAGMGGELFQNALKRTARVHGIAVDEMIAKHGSFRESLQEGWITADILTETLEQLTMSTEGLTDAEVEELKVNLQNQGYTREQAEDILRLADNAQAAATKVRTWSQLWDTVGEALGSGWTTTWRLLVGDFVEATELFTFLSDKIGALINKSADARNNVLQDWSAHNGREALVDGIKTVVDSLFRIIETIGDAFSAVFGISAEQLWNLTTGFATFVQRIRPTGDVIEYLYNAFFDFFTIVHSVLGVLGNGIRIIFDLFGVLSPILGAAAAIVFGAFGKILEIVARLASDIHFASDLIEEMAYRAGDSLSPVTNVFADLMKAAYNLVKTIASPLNSLFTMISDGFSSVVNKMLTSLGLMDETEEEVHKFSGLFAIIAAPIGAIAWAVSKVIGLITDLVKSISGGLEPIINDVTQNASGMFESIKSFFGSFKQRSKEAIDSSKEMAESFAEDASEFGSNWEESFQTFVDGVFSIGQGIKDIYGKVKERLGKIRDIISMTFAVKGMSDLKVFKGLMKKDVSEPVEETHTLLDRFCAFISETLPDAVDKFRTAVKIAFSKFGSMAKEDIGAVFDSFSNGFATLKANAHTYGVNLRSAIDDIGTIFTDFYTGLFGDPPTIADVVSKAASFAGTIAKGIMDGLGKAFADGFSVSSILNPLFNAFDWENIEVKLPDFKTPLMKLVDDTDDVLNHFSETAGAKIGSGIDFTIGKLGEVIKLFKGFATGRMFLGLGQMFSGFGKSSKGIGNFFDELRKGSEGGLKDFPKAIGELIKGVIDPYKTISGGFTTMADAVKAFGKAWDPMGKKTVSNQFKNVAIGLTALAGAFWIMSKIPMDQLKELLPLMGEIALAVLSFVAILAAISKITGGATEGVGETMRDLGIGILAIAAAFWVISNANPTIENCGPTLGILLVIMIMVGTLFAVIKDINAQGVAPALLAFSVTLIVMAGLIVALGILVQTEAGLKIGLEGAAAIVVLSAMILGILFVIKKIAANGAGKDIALASITLLSISVALGILAGVCVLLGVLNPLVGPGILVLGWIALVLVGSVSILGRFVKSGKDIALASVTLLALSVAIGLVGGVLLILGTFSEIAEVGLSALTWITICLTGSIAFLMLVADKKSGIVAASVALVLLAIAIDLVSVAVIAIGILGDKAWTGVKAVVAISVILAGLLAVVRFLSEDVKPAQLLVTTASLGLLALVVSLMAVVITALGFVMSINLPGMLVAVMVLAAICGGLAALGHVGVEGGAGLLSLAGGIAALAGSLALLGVVVAGLLSIFVPGFFENMMANFSSLGGESGENIMDGLANGVSSASGRAGSALADAATNMVSSFCERLGINSPSTVMAEMGTNIIEGLVNGITGGLGDVLGVGDEMGDSVVEGFDPNDLAGSLGEKVSTFISEFLDGVDTSELSEKLSKIATDGINSLLESIDTDIIAEKGKDIVDGLAEGIVAEIPAALGKAVLNMFQGIFLPIKMLFGINSPSTVMAELGGYIVEGLVQGLTNLEGLGSAILAIGTTIIEGIISIPGNLLSIGGEIVANLASGMSITEAVAAAAENLGIVTTDKADQTLNTGMSRAASKGMNSLLTGISSKTSAVRTTMGNVVTTADNEARGLEPKLKADAERSVQAMERGINSGVGSVRGAVHNVISAAASAAYSLYDRFYGTGQNAVRGLVDGIGSLLGSARAKADQLIQTAVDAANAAAKIHSPSKVFMGIGEYLVEGLVMGIDRDENLASKSAANLAEATIDSFSSAIQMLAADELVDMEWNPVVTPVIDPSTFDSNLDALTATMNGRLSNLSIGSLNYNEQFAGKLDTMADISREALQKYAENAIDYDRLGVSVANALIRSGIHVEMDGGELMGYLAGEIADARRMYG